MNNSDKNLKDALEDIFGDDFIEIDTNTLTSDNLSDVNERFLFTDKDEILSTNNDIKNLEPVKEVEIKEDKNNINNQKSDINDNKVIYKKPRGKHKLIIGIISIIILIICLFIFINHLKNKTRIKTCKFSINAKEYTVSEEYKITYKNNKLLYVDGIYKYNALTEEFKSQVDYIKQDKLNVLVNSNGMPGFTYIYELDTDSFKISSYLDFNLIEFDKVDKIDQKNVPLSYFNINSKLTRKKLIENLEDKYFICNKTK